MTKLIDSRLVAFLSLTFVFLSALFLNINSVLAERFERGYGHTRITDASSGFAEGIASAADSSGNVYVTGQFQGTVDFDPTAGVDSHTGAGSNDVFLTKYNADGSYGWTKSW